MRGTGAIRRERNFFLRVALPVYSVWWQRTRTQHPHIFVWRQEPGKDTVDTDSFLKSDRRHVEKKTTE